MKRFYAYSTLFYLLVALMSCQQNTQNTQENTNEAAQKAKVVNQVAELGCQDTRDLITKYGGKLIPMVGDMVFEKIIDKAGKGDFCECLRPSLEAHLSTNFELASLENLITERKDRNKVVKNVIIDQRAAILDCYKQKGTKGIKFLEKVINKLAKNEEAESLEAE